MAQRDSSSISPGEDVRHSAQALPGPHADQPGEVPVTDLLRELAAIEDDLRVHREVPIARSARRSSLEERAQEIVRRLRERQ